MGESRRAINEAPVIAKTPAAIKVLSAGAPKTGISRCAEAFDAAEGLAIAATFATAPVIQRRILEDATAWDVVIVPQPAMTAFEDDGRVVTGSAAVIGTIAAGVVVRDDAPTPDIATVKSLEVACLDADALIYNEASSGQRIAAMMDQLGITEAVAHKTVRVATGRGVMERLARGKGREIGFGQVTEIGVHIDRGVRLVGTLPAGAEIVTTYAAGLVAGAASAVAGQALIAFMTTSAGRSILADAGVS